jgi:hypothetical protein
MTRLTFNRDPHGSALPATAFCLFSLCFLAAAPFPALAQGEGEAIPGSPFGVGRLSVPIDSRLAGEVSGTDAFEITERDGRLLYPARASGLLARLAGEVEIPGRLNVWFLFRGDDPLEITVMTPEPRRIALDPRSRPRAHDRLLRQWWRQYNAAAQRTNDHAEYPSVVDHYLVSMLARRLDLQPTLPGRRLLDSGGAERGLGLLLGTQSIKQKMAVELLADRRPAEVLADQPLPGTPEAKPLVLPATPSDVKIEPIALRVPPECFYVRFGSFANYRWLKALLTEFGGELRNMVAPNGLEYKQNDRMEKQLALKETILSDLLGGQVISDVALIGGDTFFREGAAVGMLFHARSTDVLARDIKRQRDAAKAADRTATETTEKIAGRDVPFLSTPDNAIRSYYVADGDFHFVTTSRTLARRFIEVAGGNGSLGKTDEFRHARSVLPLSRNDTVFVYLSDAFFQQLTGPRYRIEMARRTRSLLETELAELAQRAARAEGRKETSLDALAEAGFLPRGFDARADGSRMSQTPDGKPLDSLRGGRGTFLPVLDVPMRDVTRDEVAEYAEFLATYESAVGRMEPVLIGLKRQSTDQKDVERVVVDAHIAPFSQSGYRRLAERLGPATKLAVSQPDGNLVSGQATLSSSILGGGGVADPSEYRYLFFGMGDLREPATARSTRWLDLLPVATELNGYVGSWPETGFLGRLLGFDGRVPEGEVAHIDLLGRLGLWVTKVKDFTVVSLNREDLLRAAPTLKMTKVETPAQVRLHVGDVSQANLGVLVSSLGYYQARSRSAANSRLLHRLGEQLHVPREDCRAVAEGLVGATIVCPLGGKYKLRDVDGMTSWVSTAWFGKDDRPYLDSAGYTAPPLRWFRGLDGYATLEPHRLSAHVEVLMRRQTASGFTLPGF